MARTISDQYLVESAGTPVGSYATLSRAMAAVRASGEYPARVTCGSEIELTLTGPVPAPKPFRRKVTRDRVLVERTDGW